MDIIQALQNQYTANVAISDIFHIGAFSGGAGGDVLPTISQGAQVLSQTITLGRATNKVYVKVALWGNQVGVPSASALFRGATCLDARGLANGQYDNDSILTMALLDEPGAVGPHTYSVRFGAYYSDEDLDFTSPAALNGLNIFGSPERLFGGIAKCTLTLLEVG
jgi:hypothetical protein